MYIEELAIERYHQAHAQWERLDEEERWQQPEPEKPQVLIRREEDEFANQSLAPDIMEIMGEW